MSTAKHLTTSVLLTDAEMALLDGQVGDKAQQKVDAAKARLAAAADLDHLDPIHAGLVADIVTEAKDSGRIIHRRERISRCTLCGTSAGYVPYKSGPNKGLPNYKKPRTLPATEFAYRFVTMQNHVIVGGCNECVAPILPDISEALRGVNAQVPASLRADGEPVRTRYENRHCTKCDWVGHEGEMGRERTIMGDGTFPAYCPSCGAGGAFSRDIGHADGFVVVAEENGSKPNRKNS